MKHHFFASKKQTFWEISRTECMCHSCVIFNYDFIKRTHTHKKLLRHITRFTEWCALGRCNTFFFYSSLLKSRKLISKFTPSLFNRLLSSFFFLIHRPVTKLRWWIRWSWKVKSVPHRKYQFRRLSFDHLIDWGCRSNKYSWYLSTVTLN